MHMHTPDTSRKFPPKWFQSDSDEHFKQYLTTIFTEGANIAQEEQFIHIKAILELMVKWKPAANLGKTMSLNLIKINLICNTKSNSFTEINNNELKI